jgi:hypothetical protein
MTQFIAFMQSYTVCAREFCTSCERGEYHQGEYYQTSPVNCGNSKAAEDCPPRLSQNGCSLLVLKIELKRHLHELGNFLPTDLRRRESHTGERILHGGGKRRVT